MMTKIFKFILLFISLAFFIGWTGILLTASSIGNLQETDVKIYSAKVESVVSNTIGTKSTCKIYTDEYDTHLLVEQEVASLYDFSNVKKGDKIVFGIESMYDELLKAPPRTDVVRFVNIVSLESENETIFTLDDYNSISQKAARIPRLINIALAVASLGVFIVLLISIVKDRRRRIWQDRGRFYVSVLKVR